MKDLKYFKKKESRINKAIDKVKAKLEEYAEYGKKISLLCTSEDRCWKEEEHIPVKDWNLLHDLQYRLEQRQWNNWSEFKDWHWDNYGFNTY